ncbi:hypothetical protein ASPZODRAFT_130055 [Penicilliopsis zonata CBS 506.65]|uniref:Uncharacterized protein n=1 Tax=Penicilliopsis zonata CBS 506.65 TaxID=1073090 RepID=A0A1L9SLQ9_9EURO|nr:hypothetical protein ASPZODRAFT_130055 [Penicilliopsis zonata CBS 506.65]OJJ48128.1 hypothetical protein ASPZODRAFT_130055 [Penicilliopsis zonata CBS 506.65]
MQHRTHPCFSLIAATRIWLSFLLMPVIFPIPDSSCRPVSGQPHLQRTPWIDEPILPGLPINEITGAGAVMHCLAESRLQSLVELLLGLNLYLDGSVPAPKDWADDRDDKIHITDPSAIWSRFGSGITTQVH